MGDCPFCNVPEAAPDILERGELCFALRVDEPVLAGSVMIVPRRHCITPFDLSPAEWSETHELAQILRERLDEALQLDGYNLGWNVGATGGQHIAHVHLHLIPRFSDEPFAGRGIRHWLKQEANRRGRTLGRITGGPR